MVVEVRQPQRKDWGEDDFGRKVELAANRCRFCLSISDAVIYIQSLMCAIPLHNKCLRSDKCDDTVRFLRCQSA